MQDSPLAQRASLLGASGRRGLALLMAGSVMVLLGGVLEGDGLVYGGGFLLLVSFVVAGLGRVHEYRGPERERLHLSDLPRDEDWVQIPVGFAGQQADAVALGLRRLGLDYHAVDDVEVRHIWFRFGDRQTVAEFLRHLLQLEAPQLNSPANGECPACGAPVEMALSCHVCGLSFSLRSEEELGDMLRFVHECGGFEGEEPVSSQP